jgi:hypothetical protein
VAAFPSSHHHLSVVDEAKGDADMTPLTRTRFLLVIAVVVLSVGIGGCVSTGVDSYEEFRSAVDSGATCEQLIDIQDNFEGTTDEDRVAKDLEEIGCDAPDSTRREL